MASSSTNSTFIPVTPDRPEIPTSHVRVYISPPVYPGLDESKLSPRVASKGASHDFFRFSQEDEDDFEKVERNSADIQEFNNTAPFFVLDSKEAKNVNALVIVKKPKKEKVSSLLYDDWDVIQFTAKDEEKFNKFKLDLEKLYKISTAENTSPMTYRDWLNWLIREARFGLVKIGSTTFEILGEAIHLTGKVVAGVTVAVGEVTVAAGNVVNLIGHVADSKGLGIVGKAAVGMGKAIEAFGGGIADGAETVAALINEEAIKLRDDATDCEISALTKHNLPAGQDDFKNALDGLKIYLRQQYKPSIYSRRSANAITIARASNELVTSALRDDPKEFDIKLTRLKALAEDQQDIHLKGKIQAVVTGATVFVLGVLFTTLAVATLGLSTVFTGVIAGCLTLLNFGMTYKVSSAVKDQFIEDRYSDKDRKINAVAYQASLFFRPKQNPDSSKKDEEKRLGSPAA